MAHIKIFAGTWRINSTKVEMTDWLHQLYFRVMRLLAYVRMSNQQDLVARLKRAMKEGQRQ
jgi:hypothetical protein